MSIFYIDIDKKIIEFIDDPLDLFRFMIINKYYYSIVNDSIYYLECKKSYLIKFNINEHWFKCHEHSFLNFDQLLLKSCISGNLRLLKYLMQTSEIFFQNIDKHLEYCIFFSCYYLKDKILKFIIDSYYVSHKNIIHKAFQQQYYNHCSDKKTEVMEFIQTIDKIYNFEIIDSNWGLMASLSSGNFILTKWFLEKTDASFKYHNFLGLRNVKRHNYIELSKKLIDLCPDIQIFIYENKILSMNYKSINID
jgi:hypothetical protein